MPKNCPPRTIFLVIGMFALSLSACGTPGAPGTGGVPPGGAVGAAWTLGGKCEAVFRWVDMLDREYPGLNDYPPYQQHKEVIPRLANLFRDRFFVPVFGTPFDKITTFDRMKLNGEVINECSGAGPKRYTKYQQSIGRYRMLLNSAFDHWSSNIASAIDQRRPLEIWMDDSLKILKDLPLDQKSFSVVESRLDEGRIKLNVLWPSEHDNFVSVYRKSWNNMASALLAKLAREVDGMEPSIANVRRIKNDILPNVETYQKAAGSTATDMRPQFTQKLETMVGRLIPERVATLKAIPDTEAGLKPSEQWYRQFDEDFSAFKHLSSITDALAILSKKRDEMYRAVKPAFLFSLNALEPRFENISRTDSLLQQAFALPNDLVLPVYGDYEKAARARKEQILGKLSEKKLAELRSMPKTVDSAVAILQWRKELEEQYGKFRSIGPIDSAFNEYDNKRMEILKGALQDFAQKQQALPPTRDGLRRSVDMLDAIFPTFNDERTMVYPEYRKIVLTRVTSIRSKMR